VRSADICRQPAPDLARTSIASLTIVFHIRHERRAEAAAGHQPPSSKPITRIDAGGARLWDTAGDARRHAVLPHRLMTTKIQWYLRLGCSCWCRNGGGRHRACGMNRAAPDEVESSGVAAQIALMIREQDFDAHDVSCRKRSWWAEDRRRPSVVREARRRFGASYRSDTRDRSGGVGTATRSTAPPPPRRTFSRGPPAPGARSHTADDGELILRLTRGD